MPRRPLLAGRHRTYSYQRAMYQHLQLCAGEDGS
jgi:hypothetical protein